jgi:hypothetical protein
LIATQLWGHGAWSVVLAWLMVSVLGRWPKGKALRWYLAAVVAVWTWLPGPYAPSYWLGLAFQAPSVTSAVVCLYWLLRYAKAMPVQVPADAAWGLWRVIGIVLGWALLFDTFAMLPGVQLYAWGFSPLLPAVLVVVLLAPWVMRGGNTLAQAGGAVAAVGMVAFHLPSGNVWDAVIDPWLWAALHLATVRAWLDRRARPE